MDAVPQSLLHTRMPQSAVRTAARDGVYREMAADFVKYLFHPAVADGTSHTLVVEMFVQAACFPRLLEGRILDHFIWLRMLGMYDETASNYREYILLNLWIFCEQIE